MKGWLLVLCLCSVSAIAAPLSGPYTLRDVRVVDGDTIEGSIQLWGAPEITLRTKFRSIGVDTPEKRAAGTCERALYDRATAFTQAWVAAHRPIEITNIDPDKYKNRYDVNILGEDGSSLAASLIQEGIGRPYDGGARKPWCAP